MVSLTGGGGLRVSGWTSLMMGRREGNTGWDQGSSHPELVKLLNSPGADDLGILKEGRALVPGCGMVSPTQLE